ncbi:putative universal stress protein [Sporotomaculum syntrophicum]|uniref:Universal stress protein n=1 Tax=Sporotomaculum syntrophicum TaxID=182264 RepID=A0A9D3AXT5_9FIRM|nr:universal stress protein [Sporotomaculum syntrophicum]KAF1085347.1 putative universal stress protein [Sporotomaculum syntrophicum]
MFKKILVPLDGSTPSIKAAKRAVKIAESSGAEVTFFHVQHSLESYINLPHIFAAETYNQIREELKAQAEAILDNAIKEVDAQGVTIFKKLSSGDPGKQIIEESQEGQYDLVVMGSRGLTGIQDFLMGSVASRVSKHAPCAVLIVR